MKKTVFSVIAAASSVVAGLDAAPALPASSPNEASATVTAIPASTAPAAQTQISPVNSKPVSISGSLQPSQPSPANISKANPAPANKGAPATASATPPADKATAVTPAPAAPFQAFTGKVIKNKVRLRIEPNVESEIVRELNRNDMFIVTGEENSFYSIKPPAGTKAYVYRTFVLDGVIEGKRVNVRLKPDTNAPVIAQLNAGDPAKGPLYPLNNKWVEIDPPAAVKFYIAKEFVERIGDADHLSTIEKLRDESSRQLNSAYLVGQSELRKPFDEINIDKVLASFDKIISTYPECPQEVERAKELRQLTRDAYTQKKIAHLETKAKTPSDSWTQKNTELTSQIETYQSRLQELEQKLQNETAKANAQIAAAAAASAKDETVIAATTPPAPPVAVPPLPETATTAPVPPANSSISEKMSVWEPLEQAFYQEWNAEQGGQASIDDYYAKQEESSVELQGILEAYSKPVKNKPGDYILVHADTKMPIAYLYSTKLDLENYVGKQVSIHGINRPNNHFAYPAYFALSVK